MWLLHKIQDLWIARSKKKDKKTNVMQLQCIRKTSNTTLAHSNSRKMNC